MYNQKFALSDNYMSLRKAPVGSSGKAMWGLARSEAPKPEHNANINCNNALTNPPFFQHENFWEGGGMSPFRTPVMISIAIVSSIAILFLDTYRGRNFRNRPALQWQNLVTYLQTLSAFGMHAIASATCVIIHC